MSEAIIVTLISTVGVIINSIIANSTNKKVEKIETLKKSLKEDINQVRYEQDKTFLTDFISDLEGGLTKSDIQIKRAYEVYEEYKKLNGNSYIMNHWNELVKEGIL